MFTTIAVLATASVGAALVTGSRVFGLKRLVKHSTTTDVAFTGAIAFGLAGTLTGLATAIVAGLFMALVLSVLKLAYGLSDRLSGGLKANVTKLYGTDWDGYNINDPVYTRGMNV